MRGVVRLLTRYILQVSIEEEATVIAVQNNPTFSFSSPCNKDLGRVKASFAIEVVIILLSN